MFVYVVRWFYSVIWRHIGVPLHDIFDGSVFASMTHDAIEGMLLHSTCIVFNRRLHVILCAIRVSVFVLSSICFFWGWSSLCPSIACFISFFSFFSLFYLLLALSWMTFRRFQCCPNWFCRFTSFPFIFCLCTLSFSILWSMPLFRITFGRFMFCHYTLCWCTSSFITFFALEFWRDVSCITFFCTAFVDCTSRCLKSVANTPPILLLALSTRCLASVGDGISIAQ